MKILMTGGGTAGHVTPNIALIPKLKEEGYEIVYIGTEKGMEKGLMQDQDVDYLNIEAGKLRRYISKENLTDILKIGKGFFQARKHIKEVKPDVVFSKGGFVSCPVVWAAWTQKVPAIIHESDLTPGLANKLSAPFAKKICYSFPETECHIKKEKAVFTGIPVRETVLNGDKEKALKNLNFNSQKPVILVIGGSLGSKSVNNIIRNSLDELLSKYQVCHICGKDGIDESLNNIQGYVQLAYVEEELRDIFALADLVISRAGATTLYELLKLEKPNILIPLPKAVSRGDQILNAGFFQREGYSEAIDEEKIDKNQLLTMINKTIENKAYYTNNMKSSNIKDSIGLVVKTINSERLKK